MATVQHERQPMWTINSSWLFGFDAAAFGCLILAFFFASPEISPTEQPEASIEWMSLIAATAVGSAFGGLASMHINKRRRFVLNEVIATGVFSALFGCGVTPLVFWYLEWGYRLDRVYGVAFGIALCAEMITKTGGPMLRNALPAILETITHIRAGQPNDDKRAIRKPDIADSSSGDVG